MLKILTDIVQSTSSCEPSGILSSFPVSFARENDLRTPKYCALQSAQSSLLFRNSMRLLMCVYMYILYIYDILCIQTQTQRERERERERERVCVCLSVSRTHIKSHDAIGLFTTAFSTHSFSKCMICISFSLGFRSKPCATQFYLLQLHRIPTGGLV